MSDNAFYCGKHDLVYIGLDGKPLRKFEMTYIQDGRTRRAIIHVLRKFRHLGHKLWFHGGGCYWTCRVCGRELVGHCLANNCKEMIIGSLTERCPAPPDASLAELYPAVRSWTDEDAEWAEKEYWYGVFKKDARALDEAGG